MKKTVLNLLLVFLIMGFLFQGASTAAVSGRTGTVQLPVQNAKLSLDLSGRNLEKITWVLESRIRGRRLPAKAVHKLSIMSDTDFQLVKSLCDRIAKEGESAGADIAFFLVTALIVVS